MALLELVRGAAPTLDLAAWHQQDPCPVLNALMRADEAAPHLAQLARFLLPRLPHGVLASSTIKSDCKPSSRVIRLEEAVAHQWMSYNSADWTNCETVDIDEPHGWRQRLADAVAQGLQPPAFATYSPWKGTVHLTWVYDRPIRNDDPDQHRMRTGIKRGLRLLFDADRRFANRLTKNPWHRGEAVPDAHAQCGDQAVWDAYQATGAALTYHTEVMDLRTVTGLALFHPLAEFATARRVTLMPRKAGAPVGQPLVRIPGAHEKDKRGTRLFLASARAVYRACTGEADVIHRIVERTAVALRSPAPPVHVAQIAQSITRFMNTRWTGPLDGRTDTQTAGRKPVDVGVMTGEAADAGPEALDSWRAMDVAEKRGAAGKRSAALVATSNDGAIRRAIADLSTAGEKVTQAAVAARSDVALRTVKRRWHTLDTASDQVFEKVPHGLIRSCGSLEPALSLCPPGPVLLLPCPPVALARQVNQASMASRRELAVCRRYQEQAARLLLPGADIEAVVPPPPGSPPSLQDAYVDACSARDLAQACLPYREQADRMLKPKAEVEAVFPPLLNAALPVRQAYEAALAARQVVQRRVEGRRRRAEAVVRAAEREDWHALHADDAPAWQARLSGIDSRETMAVERVLRANGDPDALDRIEMAFRSTRLAEHRARRRAQGTPEPVRPRRLSAVEEQELLDAIDAMPPRPRPIIGSHSLRNRLPTASSDVAHCDVFEPLTVVTEACPHQQLPLPNTAETDAMMEEVPW